VGDSPVAPVNLPDDTMLSTRAARVADVPATPGDRMARWRVKLFRLLERGERSAAQYFGIPAEQVRESDAPDEV
jgi:K+ transporter